jgi:hypothetical protein
LLIRIVIMEIDSIETSRNTVQNIIVHPTKIQEINAAKQIEIAAASEELNYRIDRLKSTLMTKASNAKILSIVHDCPCPMKCVNEIKCSNYNNNIDRLYIVKHEYVKKKIIDAILINFGKLSSVKSEHKINNGTIDILISYEKIILNYHEKTICIEVKSGQSIDLFQIERYLYESDVLLVIRVPTREVVPFHQSKLVGELVNNIKVTIEKIDLLTAHDLLKVQGDWCKGCSVTCEFRRESNQINRKAKLEFEEFYSNVTAVVHETIKVLKEEIHKVDI